MLAIDLEIQRLHALRAMQCGLIELKWLRDVTRLECAMRRHLWALKYGYNPAQPRDEIGRWEDANGNIAESGRVRLAGDIPTGDSPEVPKVRPPTSAARTAVLKQLARRLGPVATIVEGLSHVSSWLQEYHAKIDSYRDPPKSLEELQSGVSEEAKTGYQDHHIVEQTSAERDGKYPRDVIDHPDNLVRIPTMKHQDINAWYQKPNREYGGQSPREYLRDKDWDERRSVGLKALKDARVMKP
jgi:hypothetical protein